MGRKTGADATAAERRETLRTPPRRQLCGQGVPEKSRADVSAKAWRTQRRHSRADIDTKGARKAT
eukprot:2055376-Pyramimonas_sp.AAC.1